jgi:hypothetical protein
LTLTHKNEVLATLVVAPIIICVCLLSQCFMYYVWHEVQRLQCSLVILVVITSWPCWCLGVQKSSNEPTYKYYSKDYNIFAKKQFHKKEKIKGIFCNLLLKMLIIALVYHIIFVNNLE